MQKIYNLCIWHRHEYQEDPLEEKIPNSKKNPLSVNFDEFNQQTNYSQGSKLYLLVLLKVIQDKYPSEYGQYTGFKDGVEVTKIDFAWVGDM